MKSDHLAWLSCSVVGCVCAAEVSVLEPVAIAFESQYFGVVNQSVDHGGGHDVVAEDLAPPAEGLLEVTIREARS